MNARKAMIHVADQTYSQYEMLSYKVQNIETELESAVNSFEKQKISIEKVEDLNW